MDSGQSRHHGLRSLQSAPRQFWKPSTLAVFNYARHFLKLFISVSLAFAFSATIADEEPNAGQSVDGLKVILVTSNPQWAWASEKTFEVSLENTSSDRLLLDLFGEINASYPIRGHTIYHHTPWSLSWRNTQTGQSVLGPAGTREKEERVWQEDQFVQLEPGKSYQMTFKVRLGRFPIGSYEVALTFWPMVKWASFGQPADWLREHLGSDPIAERFWVRPVISNAVLIEVIDR